MLDQLLTPGLVAWLIGCVTICVILRGHFGSREARIAAQEAGVQTEVWLEAMEGVRESCRVDVEGSSSRQKEWANKIMARHSDERTTLVELLQEQRQQNSFMLQMALQNKQAHGPTLEQNKDLEPERPIENMNGDEMGMLAAAVRSAGIDPDAPHDLSSGRLETIHEGENFG